MRLQKEHFRSIRFPSVSLVLQENFSLGCVQDTRNSAVFGSGSAHVRNFQNVSLQQGPLYPDIYGYATDSVQEIRCINWSYGTFYVLQKTTKSLTFGPGTRPCTERNQIEHCVCIPFSNRSLPTFIQIGRHLGGNGGRKIPVSGQYPFQVIIEHGHAMIWSSIKNKCKDAHD